MRYQILYHAYPKFPHISRLIYKRRRLIIINTAAALTANIIQFYPNN